MVTTDIPDNADVVGIPGKVISLDERLYVKKIFIKKNNYKYAGFFYK